MTQVAWGLPFHRGARCEWYVAPYCEGNPSPGPEWLPLYVESSTIESETK